MDAVYNLLSRVNTDSKRDLLQLMLGVIAVCTIPFFICALVVSDTANAGFDVVFTALLNFCFIGGSYFVITYSKTSLAVGFMLGTGAMLSLQNLMTAIYWGQLSNCRRFVFNFSQYTCDHPSVYTAVCFFAVCLFLGEVVYTIGAFLWRSELVDDETVTVYGAIQTTNSVPVGESIYLKSPYPSTVGTSADL